MEGRNMGFIRGESPKYGVTIAKDLTKELPERREPPYPRLC